MRRKTLCCTIVLSALFLGGCDGGSLAKSVVTATDTSSEILTPVMETLAIDDMKISADNSFSVRTAIDRIEFGNVTKAAKAEGIILQSWNWGPTYDYKSRFYEIWSIDPITGQSALIRTFRISNSCPGANEYYRWPLDSNTGNNCDWFSPDLTKIICDRVFLNSSEGISQKQHAGWVSEDGTFFDVTKAVGEESVFVDETAVGFTPDGLFVYRISSDFSEDQYRYVSIDDPCKSYEGNPLEKAYLTETFLGTGYMFTDWINDTTCLVDIHNDSSISGSDKNVKYDISSGKEIPYTAKVSSSGVVNPDGTSIAFLSRCDIYDEKSDLYMVSEDGGIPIRIDCDMEIYTLGSSVIDWR